METLIVKPKNMEELHFVQTMLNRMRIKSEVKEVDTKKRLKKEFLDSEIRFYNIIFSIIVSISSVTCIIMFKIIHICFFFTIKKMIFTGSYL